MNYPLVNPLCKSLRHLLVVVACHGTLECGLLLRLWVGDLVGRSGLLMSGWCCITCMFFLFPSLFGVDGVLQGIVGRDGRSLSSNVGGILAMSVVTLWMLRHHCCWGCSWSCRH